MCLHEIVYNNVLMFIVVRFAHSKSLYWGSTSIWAIETENYREAARAQSTFE